MKLLFPAAVLGLVAAFPAHAQSAGSPEVVVSSLEARAVPLGTGGVPGMPPESWSNEGGSAHVRNVSRATLTPFLPARDKATGAAVIILPGGAFFQLAIEKEGWAIAHQLADRGIAAFVLKYRLRPTPADPREMLAQRRAAPHGPLDLSTPRPALDDALAALRLVRARARTWSVDPARVGMLGFSAGAMTALSVLGNAQPAEMPAFAGVIYGPMLAMPVPTSAPSMFAAIAADDPLFGGQGYGLIEGLQKVGKPVELHVYQKGGHGFGSGIPGTTTVEWLASFDSWLRLNRLTVR